MNAARTTKGRTLLSAALLAAVATAIYLPSLRNGFVWDDDTFLTANPLIRVADGLRRFWFTTQPPDYWPVTETSLWLEWRLWGMHAMGYHATNLALHVLICLLLWAVLRRLRIRGAWLGALLFAVHPVNVESVAWITQRKNLMAMLFFLPAILFFLRAEPETPAPPGKLWKPGAARWILLSLIAFTLAMLSKGSVVILPVVLLGIILWHRRPTWSDGAVLAPFCAVAAVLAAVNVWFQGHGASEVVRNATPLDRLLGAAAALCFYLSKAIWPHPLAFIYPQWTVSAGDPLWWLPLLGASALTLWLWRLRLQGARPALFAWGYFALALAPALGFTDITFMKYSLVADHYQHLALIGLTTLAGFGWRSLFDRLQGTLRAAWIGLAAGVVLFFAVLTVHQCRIYRNAFTLYEDILAKNPACWLAENNLGDAWAQLDQPREAIVHYERALEIKPGLPEAENDLGNALAAIGRPEDAIPHFERALETKPDFPEADYNWGHALADLGRTGDAIERYEKAVLLRPEYAAAHYNLALALMDEGRPSEAVDQYEAALRFSPDSPSIESYLADALAASGQPDEAVLRYEQALRLRPNFPEAENNLALALVNLGRLPEAIACEAKAVRLRPGWAEAHGNLALMLDRAGRPDEAAAEFAQAQALKAAAK